jgi:hypothetical protein
MGNRTKAQVRASKTRSNRNTKVMQAVSEQLKAFDKENPIRNYTARDAFAKQCLEQAQASIT